MTRSRTWLGVLALCFLVYGGWLVSTAHAAVRVTITSSVREAPVRSLATLTVHVETDAPVTLSDVRLLLPGHGVPPNGGVDEPGKPRGHDPNTHFDVIDPRGATQQDRWLTWAGPFLLAAGETLDESAVVELPDAEAWYPSGATVTAPGPVTGCARCAWIHATQDTSGLYTSSTVVVDGDEATFRWVIGNGSASTIRVVQERFGLPAGFGFVSSTLGSPRVRSATRSTSWQWHAPLTLDPHSQAIIQVVARVPCTVGEARSGSRQRVWSESGTIAGTGDEGAYVRRPVCAVRRG